jgi:hypothetical protein
VWGNTASNNPNVYCQSDTPTWTYSLVEGSEWGAWGTATNSGVTANTPFESAIPAAPTTGGNYQLKAGVIGAIDAGSNTLYFDQAMPTDWNVKTGLDWAETLAKDLAGNTRKVNNTIDMGAYEKQ